jgi:hypothetical protein
MREVRVQVPKGQAKAVVQKAIEAGASRATVYQLSSYPGGHPQELVSLETSTPIARAVIDRLITTGLFDPKTVSITSRELRAVLSDEEPEKLLKPMREPELDVLQQLWAGSYITTSLVLRVALAGSLLAYAMIHDNNLLIVAALLTSPFLSQIISIVFGLYAGDRRLARLGAASLGLSTLITIVAGAVLASVDHQLMLFNDFGEPLPNFLISLGVGIAAGVATLDDVGWRHLLGLGAASQYAKYPIEFGYFLVRGVDDWTVARGHFYTFLTNLALIAVAALAVYALMRMRRHLVPWNKSELPRVDFADRGTYLSAS